MEPIAKSLCQTNSPICETIARFARPNGEATASLIDKWTLSLWAGAGVLCAVASAGWAILPDIRSIYLDSQLDRVDTFRKASARAKKAMVPHLSVPSVPLRPRSLAEANFFGHNMAKFFISALSY